MKNILKTIVFGVCVLTVSSCVSHGIEKNDEIVVVKPLPIKCGQYDIVYGKVDSYGVFRKMDGTVVNLLSTLDIKRYKGMKLLLKGKYWYQRGGLLNPDGSDASFSIDNLLEASVIQVVDNGFDYALIERKCNELKEKQ